MNFKRVITEYWEIFWTNTYDGARKEQNMKNIRVALLLMAAFSFVMSLMNVANGNRRMLVATAILCVLFLITAFACRSERGRAVGITVCVLSVAVIFTFFVFSGGRLEKGLARKGNLRWECTSIATDFLPTGE